MTNLGPLLSTFTPAASCASYTGMTVFYTGTNFWWAEGPMNTQGCYPSSYSPGLASYYSPGICPSGYTTACTSLNSIGTVTETIHTCCPAALGISYNCAPTTNPFNTFACTTSFTTEVTITGPTIVSDGITSTQAAISYPSGGGIAAFGIAVRYQTTDFLTSSSTAAVSSTSLAAGSTIVGVASSSSNAAASHGLSSGASAGIGVGVAALVLAIAIGSFIIWRRGRGPRGRKDAPVSASELSAEKHASEVHEVATQEIHEVPGAKTSELPA